MIKRWIKISKRLWDMTDFSDQFRKFKVMIRCKRIGFNFNVTRQSVCLVSNPITVDKFNCTPVDCASDFMMVRSKAIHFNWLGRSFGRPGLNRRSSFAPDFQWCCLTSNGSPVVTQHILSVEYS